MSNIYFSLLLSFVFCFVKSQNKIAVDTIKSNITVQYGRVEFSDGWASEAALQSSYEPISKKFMLFFEVPNYDVRYKTTRNDYAIIRVKNKLLKLENQAEIDADGLIQKFIFHVSRDTIEELVNIGFKKITFYFAPNEDLIVNRVANEKNLNPHYKERICKLAKDTVKTTIWRPDKKKLQELKFWLEKL